MVCVESLWIALLPSFYLYLHFPPFFDPSLVFFLDGVFVLTPRKHGLVRLKGKKKPNKTVFFFSKKATFSMPSLDPGEGKMAKSKG